MEKLQPRFFLKELIARRKSRPKKNVTKERHSISTTIRFTHCHIVAFILKLLDQTSISSPSLLSFEFHLEFSTVEERVSSMPPGERILLDTARLKLEHRALLR